MKVLTPAALTPHGGSLRLLYLVFRTSNPQPRDGPERRFPSRLNALDGSCDPGFAMNEQARRTMPPKRVRHPAGCSFASSCSPPRIAATQLPSATCATTSHRTDFHPPDKATSQTHSSSRTRGSRGPRGRPDWPELRAPRVSLPAEARRGPLDSRFRGNDKKLGRFLELAPMGIGGGLSAPWRLDSPKCRPAPYPLPAEREGESQRDPTPFLRRPVGGVVDANGVVS